MISPSLYQLSKEINQKPRVGVRHTAWESRGAKPGITATGGGQQSDTKARRGEREWQEKPQTLLVPNYRLRRVHLP